MLVFLIQVLLDPGRRAIPWFMGYLCLELLCCASLGYRAWTTRGEGRLAWWLLASAAFLDVVGVAFMLVAAPGVHVAAWASVLARLLSLGTAILVLAGILSFPKGKDRRRGDDWRRILDGLIFATSLLFLLWVVGVQAGLRAPGQGLGFRVLVAYLNASLLGGSLIYMTSYQPERFKGPLVWLGASALAWLVALSGWTLAGLPSAPEGNWWWAVVGGIPVFQGVAAWSPSFELPTVREDPRRLVRLLPYLPMVVSLGAMAMLIPRASLDALRGASCIFLVMVVLLLLRQFQAIRDLRVARRTLEDRVHQRTKALEQAQGALLRTERMNTVALMGAGLAHDLNNLLTVIKSSAELANMSLEDGESPSSKDLQRMAASADRAAQLTQRLMGFARREAEELAPTDLGLELEQIESTLRLLLPHTVSLLVEVSREEPLVVLSSRLQLEQILVNLVANARDAMPGGGHLSIRLGLAPDLDQAMIEVADTGTGMAPEILERIFDPFFTTKPPGKGTGLGLPSIKAMVEASGGRLEVSSEPGQGTRFRILMPRL